jgi:hypothetical protein
MEINQNSWHYKLLKDRWCFLNSKPEYCFLEYRPKNLCSYIWYLAWVFFTFGITLAAWGIIFYLWYLAPIIPLTAAGMLLGGIGLMIVIFFIMSFVHDYVIGNKITSDNLVVSRFKDWKAKRCSLLSYK